MIVPITGGTYAQTNAMPSDTNLLMALATMKKNGSFDQNQGEAPRSHHSPIEKMEKDNG